MQTRRWLAGVGAGSLLLVGGLAAGPVASFAQGETASPAAQVTTQTEDAEQDAEEQDPSYTGSIQVPEGSVELNEADERAALQSLATITADEASQAALAANAGTTVASVELDDENGSLIYEVTLSSGVDVKVDAGTGDILATDQADDESEDDTEDESENEAEDEGNDTEQDDDDEPAAPTQP